MGFEDSRAIGNQGFGFRVSGLRVSGRVFTGLCRLCGASWHFKRALESCKSVSRLQDLNAKPEAPNEPETPEPSIRPGLIQGIGFKAD